MQVIAHRFCKFSAHYMAPVSTLPFPLSLRTIVKDPSNTRFDYQTLPDGRVPRHRSLARYDTLKHTDYLLFSMEHIPMLRTITATRYVTPLREGGSLPAIVEADDDGLYVLKFRGAGQGTKALIAELVAGEIGRALQLPVPEIVFMELDPVLGRSEPDFEIQALIKASAGLNLALDFLPGALAYTPAAPAPLDAAL